MSPTWPKTRLTDLLELSSPIMQAGMGGGITSPELVSEVCRAGALGQIGAGYLAPDAIAEQVRAVRALTDRPFGLNLMAHQRHRPLASLDAELDDQLDVVEQANVPVVTFTYGPPPSNRLARLRRSGTRVGATATTVAEARLLEDLGVDFVVVQGAEAAGTRATFAHPFGQGMVGTLALVPQVVDAIPATPVVAAGGIADGRGAAAARILGADGVQLGTVFLVAAEASTPAPVKVAALAADETDSTLTSAIHGRPGRALRNGLVQRLEKAGGYRPYPHQYDRAHALHDDALRHGDRDGLVVWLGMVNRLAREDPAAQIVARIEREAAQALR